MKNSKFLVVLYVLTFVVVLIGSTLAFFTQTNSSNEGAVAGGSAKVGINLAIAPLYTEKELIPMNDADVIKAFKEYQCIDINDYGACQAYTITIENIGTDMEYSGTIKFNMNHITNLNYLILDEDDNVYADITNIDVDATPGQSLGDSFELAADETKVFKLIIWVPNYEYDQFENDGAGIFNATVTYTSTTSYKLSGSISGN